ncbi:ABC transporter permease [Propioniciclava flava]|uniref:Peptide ABC transporter permease n=1 Tax=Propioniciclava flava TaxID=2072026 RepID=A0A4Q2EI59_9ACTN|nr:ABC transporter permease [Propioniciclava flava]RXW33277.1 peptide ABC transporter permease [Propioniciclava flava]
MKRRELRVGIVLVGLIVAMALVSFVWTPFSPTAVNSTLPLQPPGWPHVLGSDHMGIDTLSRIMVGARSALYVGVIAVGLAAVVGVPLGVASASLPRWAAEVVLRITDITYAFPALLLAILLAGALGASTETAMVAIGIASVPQFLRIARAGAMSVLASDFVLAAKASGTTRLRIAVLHVLPNIAPLIGVQVSVSFALAILAEAALSYLGLGTPSTVPSWGRMLGDAQTYLFTQPAQAIWPGLSIALTVLGFNLVGDGLRDVLDPQLREVA